MASGASNRKVMYSLKHIKFLGRNTPIILQNENGPCPLLAICNVLLLRNAIHLQQPNASVVSQDELLNLVTHRLLEANSNLKNKGLAHTQNQQQNISDAMDLLPKLATGIDVNVYFTKINGFEFTRELAIFDLLDIELYHGWIVDPQDKITTTAIGSKSYNALMRDIVSHPIRAFIQNNRSQLTVHGLFRLQQGLNERKICVFFRNNHFSTMFKLKGGLYLLATDEGYINHSDLVWEKLVEENGNTMFVTSTFEEFRM